MEIKTGYIEYDIRDFKMCGDFHDDAMASVSIRLMKKDAEQYNKKLKTLHYYSEKLPNYADLWFLVNIYIAYD